MGLITKKEAAAILGRSERCIVDWINAGVLKQHIVKHQSYIDSDTVWALKDTEAEIDKARAERDKELSRLNNEIREMRKVAKLDSQIVRVFLKSSISHLGLHSVSGRERQVVEDICDGWSLEQIGENMGLTRERIRQIFEKSMRKLCIASDSYPTLLDKYLNAEKEISILQTENMHLRKEIERISEGKVSADNNILQYPILAEKVGDLELSIRTLNCLKYCDIETVYDLVQFSPSELLRFRNFGYKSLREVEHFLAENGLRLGMSLRAENQNEKIT